MGVTIHYRGFLKDKSQIDECLQLISDWATDNQWECHAFSDNYQSVERTYEDDAGNIQTWHYSGPIKGLVLQPHPNCESMTFEFGEDLYFAEYVKTQFAPLDVHVGIINLLKLLQPMLQVLDVLDEGEYWDTQDISLLEHNQMGCWAMIQEKMKEDPTFKGPVRMSDGRIADLIKT